MEQNDRIKQGNHRRRVNGYRTIMSKEEREMALMSLRASKEYLDKFVSATSQRKRVAREFLNDMEDALAASLLA